MTKILEEQVGGKKLKILLHSCCAPCSSACIERLNAVCDLTIFYYNPNIDAEKEYVKRQEEQKRLCKLLNIKIIENDYNKAEYDNCVVGLENEKEGGKRCEKCFELRLKKTAQYASKNGYDYFATTLTVSPLKNSDLINRIGFKIEKDLQTKYLPTDFKKQNGYLSSIELSKKYGLYRQNYCGCEYSKKERETALQKIYSDLNIFY